MCWKGCKRKGSILIPGKRGEKKRKNWKERRPLKKRGRKKERRLIDEGNAKASHLRVGRKLSGQSKDAGTGHGSSIKKGGKRREEGRRA